MIEIDLKKVPQHIAIIMDGNGRWATRQNLPRLAGHKKGTEVVEAIIPYAKELGVKYLTLYAFSRENWNRPPEEVLGLMNLLIDFLVSKRKKLIEYQVRLTTIGEIDLLPDPVLQELQKTMEMTQDFTEMRVVLALSYGSRNEIVQGIERLIKKRFEGPNPFAAVSPEEFAQYLSTQDIPDPDLLIRTSGEHRISNFLLWQAAYAEFYFTETLWPDFNNQELLKAIAEYQNRERRYGLTSDQVREF